MANFDKFTMAACGHIFAHNERSKNENGEYIRFGNRDIDVSRSEKNYNMAAADQPLSQIEFLQKRLSEVKCQKRKDVNVIGSWIFTLPEDVPERNAKLFFELSYEFGCKKYGKENVVSAWVHNDESGQPHMHFCFVPVVQDVKWNKKHPDQPRKKVSAKECVTKVELLSFHEEYQAYIDSRLNPKFRGYYNVHNGATKDGNLTIPELKAQREKLRAVNEELQATQKALKRFQEAQEQIVDESAAKIVAKANKGISDAYRGILPASWTPDTLKNILGWEDRGLKIPKNSPSWAKLKNFVLQLQQLLQRQAPTVTQEEVKPSLMAQLRDFQEESRKADRSVPERKKNQQEL